MMRCPTCRSTQTKVVDSRIRESHDSVYRRRKCLDCRGTWSTFEIDKASFEAANRLLAMRTALKNMAAEINDLFTKYQTSHFK